jgi:hypothetical protein
MMNRIMFFILVKSLKWFCRNELDQFENWVIRTKFGPVYISIGKVTDHPKVFTEIK